MPGKRIMAPRSKRARAAAGVAISIAGVALAFAIPFSAPREDEASPSHKLEHLRSEHAHRHLGVSEADFERWAEKAGLAVRSAKTFRSPGGDKGVAVMLWTADSQKDMHQKDGQKTGKRSAA